MINENLKRKLLFRASHRGIREMDIILGRYCSLRIETMTAQQIEVLAAVLALNDQPMYKFLSEDLSQAALTALVSAVPSELHDGVITMLSDIHHWMRAHPYRGGQ